MYWSAGFSNFIYPGQFVGRGVFPHVRWFHDWTFTHGRTNEALYPGLLIFLLAVVALINRRQREMVGLAVTTGVIAALLSFGPEVHLFGWSFAGPFDYIRRIPPVNMMRVPSRIGILSVLAIVILAGIGWELLTRRMSKRITWSITALAALVLVIELHPWNLRHAFRPIPRPPSYTRWLARAPRGPVLELPYESSALFMLWSTKHWQPLVNGWGAFPAPLAESLGGEALGFPRPAFTARIQDAGVRYIVAHMDRLGRKRRRRILDLPLPPGVRLIGIFDNVRVYELAETDE